MTKIYNPAPIQMSFPKAHGDCHIKAGFKNEGDIFIVNIATGFYQNIRNDLPPPGDGTVDISKLCYNHSSVCYS